MSDEQRGIVGGQPVAKRRASLSIVFGSSFALAVSGFALSASCGSCTPEPVPPPPPPPPPVTSTVSSSTTGSTTSSTSSSTTGAVEPGPECVFVRPKAARDGGRVFDPRIVGGTDATAEEAPWMASLQVTSHPSGPDAHFCGGAVYGGRFVLTAGHCVQHTGRMRVVVGRTDLRSAIGWEFEVEARNVMMPARKDADGKPVALYSAETLDWDAALIDLGGPAGVDSLDFQEGDLEDGVDKDGKLRLKKAQAFGWGRVYSGGPIAPELQKIADMPRIIPQANCRAYYDNLTARMVCSDMVGSGSCQGDSGGPLLVDGKRIGIVSFGVGCADGWPGVYAYTGAGDADLGYSSEIGEWVKACTAH